MIFFRTPYNYDVDAASLEAGLSCPGPDMTQQQFTDECDINNIVRRFGVTGQVPVPSRLPSYDDFSGITDYQTAMETVRAAQESFAALPSSVRSRFANDPQQLLEFLGDQRNRDEAVALGLVNGSSPAGTAAEPAAAPAPSP